MKGVLVAFSVKTKKFKSRYEITKFFRSLYGWKQVVSCANGRYTYKREGLLTEIPHLKVDQSSFIIPEEFLDDVTEFFEKWSDKVIFKTLKVLVEEDLQW